MVSAATAQAAEKRTDKDYFIISDSDEEELEHEATVPAEVEVVEKASVHSKRSDSVKSTAAATAATAAITAGAAGIAAGTVAEAVKVSS